MPYECIYKDGMLQIFILKCELYCYLYYYNFPVHKNKVTKKRNRKKQYWWSVTNTVMTAIAKSTCNKMKKESYNWRMLTGVYGRVIQDGMSKDQMG